MPKMKNILVLLSSFILLGMSEGDLRKEQESIQNIIKQTQRINKKPSPLSDVRAARTQRNRYQNQHYPYFPKTIYREPLKTLKRNRFFR